MTSSDETHENRKIDLLLFAIFTPLLISVLFFHIYTVANGGSTIPSLRVEFNPAPVLVDVNRDIAENILPGDVFISLNGNDVSDISPFGFKLLIAHLHSNTDRIKAVLKRGEATTTGYLIRRTHSFAWSVVPMTVGFSIVAMLILWKAPNSPGARYFFVGCMSLPIFQCTIEYGSELQIAIGMVFFVLFGLISLTCILCWVIGFPKDVNHQTSRWGTLFFAFLMAVLWMVPRLNYYFSGPLPVDNYDNQTYLLNVVMFLFIIGTISWNYKRVDGANRRRARWVLLGVYVALVPNILVRTIGLWLDETAFEIVYNICRLFYLAIPISIWLAIAHFHLYDVDRVFGGAISYTLLLVVIAIGAEAILEPLAGFLAIKIGMDANVGQLIFVAVIAALAVPAQKVVRPHVLSILLAHQKPFAEAMAELMATLSNEQGLDLEETSTVAAAKTADTLGVDNCLLALKPKTEWEIWYSQGIDTHIDPVQLSACADSLTHQFSPIQPDHASLWHTTFNADIVFPLHHNGTTIGFLAFGRKTSGDIFTGSEQSMIVAMTALLSLRASSTTA